MHAGWAPVPQDARPDTAQPPVGGMTDQAQTPGDVEDRAEPFSGLAASGELSSSSYSDPLPGWSATTPHGAPWPYDPALLDQPLAPAADSPQMVPLASPLAPLASRARPELRQRRQEAPVTKLRLEPLLELPRPGQSSPGHADGRDPAAYPGGEAGWLGRPARRWLVLGGAAVAVMLAVAAVVLGFSGRGGSVKPERPGRLSASGHVLSFPRVIGSYTRAEQGHDRTLTSADSFVSAVRTAVYQRNARLDQAGGLLASSIGVDTGYVHLMPPGSVAREIYEDFKRQISRLSDGQAELGKPRDFTPGSLGGKVRCWSVSAPSGRGSGRSAGAACVWADNDTFGFVFAPGLQTSSLATTLLTFRTVIEMPSH